MGKASCIAVRDASVETVLDRLGLVLTGEIDRRNEWSMSCAQLSGGWVVVTASDFDFFSKGRLQAASLTGDLVGCQFWDVVMLSEAWGYRRGEKVWSVLHDSEKDLRHLAVEGDPPEALETIRARLEARQDGEDDQVDHLFGAPLELMRVLSGFRPDMDCVDVSAVFRFVTPARSGRAAQRLAEEAAIRNRFTEQVEAVVYPRLEALGFESLVKHPDFRRYYPQGASNVFIRLREGLSECVEVVWDLVRGQPAMRLAFFVRRGSAPRGGWSGSVVSALPKRSFLSRFSAPKLPTIEQVDASVVEGLGLLDQLDRHLVSDEVGPNLEPARYEDEVQAG